MSAAADVPRHDARSSGAGPAAEASTEQDDAAPGRMEADGLGPEEIEGHLRRAEELHRQLEERLRATAEG